MPAGDRKVKKEDSKLRAIHVTDVENAANGNFVAVITLQRGEAPEVSSEVSGNSCEIRVGEFVVSYADKRFAIPE